MLTGEHREPRPARSLRQEYEQFIEQRIEEYKDSLPRADILSIGDEAMSELSGTLQFQLTEVVLRDQVDAIIRRRLKLPSFRRWRERHLALRAAQVQPSHWGLAAHDPVALLGGIIEPDDQVLIIGAGDGACALYLAAHGALVHVCDPDIVAVCGLENRAVLEQLGASIECTVTQLEFFDPFAWFVACVIEVSTLAAMPAQARLALIDKLKTRTPAGGRHAVMALNQAGRGDVGLSTDAVRSLYSDWTIESASSGKRGKALGFTAIRPGAGQNGTEVPVS